MAEFVTTADGVRLSLYQIGDPGGVPVILSHGTFSNHRTCAGLANFLAKKGYSCWIFDWRGHGASDRAVPPHTFDDIALLDVPAIIDTVTNRSSDPVFWVGHSGGALILLMWMARFPHLAARHIKGLIMLASQATGAATSIRNRTMIFAIDWFLRWRARAPGHWLDLGPEPESALLIRQWCRWNLTQSFSGQDGFDYQRAISRSELPILAFAGAGDGFVAPACACHAFASSFSTDVEFHFCSKQQGFREDYTHNRLILSRNASVEIWPLVTRWLRARNELSNATIASVRYPAGFVTTRISQ